MKPTTISERCARTLLSAWNSGNLPRVQAAIEQTEAVPRVSLASSEQERVELIQGIAAMIRLWLDGRRTEADLNVSLQLLRHLAHDVTGDESGMDSNLREAPLPEMHAFAQN